MNEKDSYDEFIDNLPPRLRLKVVQSLSDEHEAPTGRAVASSETALGGSLTGRKVLVVALVAPILASFWIVHASGQLAEKLIKILTGYLRKELKK